jgi:putative addiction module component (TIGR02574 family)
MEMDISHILKLSIPERILLVEAIWDSIAREKKKGSTFSLSQEQIMILEEEMANYELNPEEGSSWEEIKKRIYKTDE